MVEKEEQGHPLAHGMKIDPDQHHFQLEFRRSRRSSNFEEVDEACLTVLTLRAPAQFFATKLGEEAQTRPAEYLATSAIMSKGHYSLECRTDITLLKQFSLPVRQQRLLLTKQISLCRTNVHHTSSL